MKYKYLLFASVLLLSSCNITKRKYLPGYSIQWARHGIKTIIPNQQEVCPINVTYANPGILASKEYAVSEAENPAILSPLQVQHPVNHQNITSNTIESNGKVLELNPSKPYPTIPDDSTRARLREMMCKQAKVSQHLGTGGLSLTLFSLGLWALVEVLINTGTAWATPMLAVAVVTTGAVAGGLMGLLAIIFAIIAFHKIHLEKAKYIGAGKAVSGIIFATILFLILGYMALLFL